METNIRKRLLTLVSYLTDNNECISAMECITELINGDFAGTKECYSILEKLEEYNITGVRVVYLWELCKDNISNIYFILKRCPKSIVENALLGRANALIEIQSLINIIQ
jgi:hypothetical protein